MPRLVWAWWMGVCVALAAASAANTPAWARDELKIATFNIQDLGRTKAAKPAVMKYLAGVIRKFDLVAVQEVSDVQEKVPAEFLALINATGRHYAMILSPRTGREPDDKPSQEQYAFYYDADVVEAMDGGALFDDSAQDLFEREPFTARFKLSGTSLTFTVTEVHTDPDVALAEIDALDTVYRDVRARYGSETQHIILGDFNADCGYASPAKLDRLAIRGPTYKWIVPDGADTTVAANTDCAYDRIILSRALMRHFKSWGVASWFTDKKYSDHWPVWIRITASPG